MCATRSTRSANQQLLIFRSVIRKSVKFECNSTIYLIFSPRLKETASRPSFGYTRVFDKSLLYCNFDLPKLFDSIAL